MKVYTQTGDQGQTTLLSGERVSKNHPRVHAYGEVDELNSVIGAIAAFGNGPSATEAAELRAIQRDLFDVSAWLAASSDCAARAHLTPITAEHCRRLEDRIDAMTDGLPALNTFILPGGHPSAAWAHVARSVCRRVERCLVALADASTGQDSDGLAPILAYLNRLSDFLFVLARHLNQTAGVADLLWPG